MCRPVATLLEHAARMKLTYFTLLRVVLVTVVQWTQNGIMFVDLDLP